jgi:uncharacterized cupin superfamily protein
MTTPAILHFDDLSPQTTIQYPDPERRIKGNPKRTAQEYFANELHGVRAGIWHGETGSYRIALAADKHEFFHITAGRVIISAPDGSEARQFGPGETGVITPGFEGIFEIVEAASKFWVVTEHAAA